MIWLILAVGFLLRIISLNQSLWLDEAINVLATRNFSFLGMITDYAKSDFHPPLYFIVLWLWTKLFGIGEVFVRMPSVIFGVITIYIVFLIGQKIHSNLLGFIAALLLAINPLHIYYSQEARMYSLATLAVSINILLLVNYLKKKKINFIFLVFSNLSILLSDYVAYFVFPAMLVFLLINNKQEFLKKWFLSIIIAVLLGIWWLPTFLNQIRVGEVTSSSLPAWKLVVGSLDLKGIPLNFHKIIIGRISLSDKFVYAVILIPISLLFLYLCIKGVKLILHFAKTLLICWLIIPVMLAYLASFFIPIYSYFRLLFTLSAFLILVSSGIISHQSKIRYLFLTIVILIEITSSLIYLSQPVFQREDWRSVVEFLKSQNKNSLVLFESSGTLPPFDYYSANTLNAEGILRNFPASSEKDISDLSKLTRKTENIYLVNYLVDISDPKRLAGDAIEKLGYRIMETKDFHGVGFIFHYVK